MHAVGENVEREKCKNNLIFYSIPKHSDAPSNEQCVQKDVDTVIWLCIVESEFGLRVVQLGASNQSTSKACLLLVEFGNVSTKRSILKQAATLRKSSTWSNVYIAIPRFNSKGKIFSAGHCKAVIEKIYKQNFQG